MSGCRYILGIGHPSPSTLIVACVSPASLRASSARPCIEYSPLGIGDVKPGVVVKYVYFPLNSCGHWTPLQSFSVVRNVSRDHVLPSATAKLTPIPLSLAVISKAVLVNGPTHSLLPGYKTLLRFTIVPFGSFTSIVGDVVLNVTVGGCS